MRRRVKRTCSLILARTLCLRRCAVSSTTSPNQEGVAGTDSEEVWICTDPSAILVICASLRESVCFFLLKKAHVYPCLLHVSRSLRIAWDIRLPQHKVDEGDCFHSFEWRQAWKNAGDYPYLLDIRNEVAHQASHLIRCLRSWAKSRCLQRAFRTYG